MTRKKFNHLTKLDRYTIEKMELQGFSRQVIADTLGVHVSTIYRELKRGRYEHTNADLTTEERYSPDIAHQKYRAMIHKKGPAPILPGAPDLLEAIADYITRLDYSPQAAIYAINASGKTYSATIRTRATIYTAIRRGYFPGLTMKDLPNRGRHMVRRKQKVTKQAPPGTSIEKRPAYILRRDTFGHWEMDLVVGPAGSSRALLVLTERLTRYEIIEPIKNHTTKEVARALNRIEKEYGSLFYAVFKSITVDNGAEFKSWPTMQKALYRVGDRTKIYYCHGYSPHERGSNENQNRFIRRRYPKGTNFDDLKLTRRDTAYLAAWINDYPRHIFDGETSGQRFAREIDKMGFT